MDIRVEHLEYVYNEGTPLAHRALTDVDFALESGRSLGILGGTGSGKTTLIRHLNGLLLPTRGNVLVGGTKTRAWGPELRRRVGVVFQRPERQLFEETVYDDISFVLRRSSGLSSQAIMNRVRTACRLIGLDIDGLGSRSPLKLSQGEKRKAAIAGILVNEPDVLILDEPSVGMDPPSVAELVKLLEEMRSQHEEKTLVVVSHDMEPFLHLLDCLLFVHEGRIVAFGDVAHVCDLLAEDEITRKHVPPMALLIHDLKKAGMDLSDVGFQPSEIADAIEVRLSVNGGSR